MPTIVFRVNLTTVDRNGDKPPYNWPADSDYFAATRSTWFPNRMINNYKLKSGDEFTATGLNALYLKNNFSTGEFKFLDIVSETA